MLALFSFFIKIAASNITFDMSWNKKTFISWTPNQIAQIYHSIICLVQKCAVIELHLKNETNFKFCWLNKINWYLQSIHALKINSTKIQYNRYKLTIKLTYSWIQYFFIKSIWFALLMNWGWKAIKYYCVVCTTALQ